MDSEQLREEIKNSRSRLYDKEGNSLGVYWYKGLALPDTPPVPLAVSKLHNISAKDDDIIICAYPSCGTHWIWEIASMIMKERAERIPSIKEEYMLEFVEHEKLEMLESPRVMNTHFRPGLLPESILKSKIILVARNPKAVAVSYYRHQYGILEKKYNGNFSNFFEMFINGEVPYGDYFEYLNQWTPVIKGNPNGLIVTYEEASQNLCETVLTIAKFLGKDISQELAANIAELCTFDRMKNEKSVMKENFVTFTFRENCSFYRDGKVSTWKRWMTVDQSETMDTLIQTKLTDNGINLNF
ncbi:estrogen sulfotransferase-like [Argonauta hians]